MSWGIEFNTDIFLSKQNYGENIYQVNDKIEELKEDLSNSENKILMYSIGTLKDFVPIDWEEEPIEWLHRNMKLLFDEVCLINQQLTKMYLYKQYLEEKE